MSELHLNPPPFLPLSDYHLRVSPFFLVVSSPTPSGMDVHSSERERERERENVNQSDDQRAQLRFKLLQDWSRCHNIQQTLCRLLRNDKTHTHTHTRACSQTDSGLVGATATAYFADGLKERTRGGADADAVADATASLRHTISADALENKGRTTTIDDDDDDPFNVSPSSSSSSSCHHQGTL